MVRHWLLGDQSPAWKEVGSQQVGAPHPHEEERVSRELAVSGEAVSRPRGWPPVSTHPPTRLQQPRPACQCHGRHSLPGARPGLTHDGSSAQAGDAHAPHTPGAATPAQALNSLYLQPLTPRWVAPRGACMWAGRAVPTPRAGPDLWSASVSCESAQHLLAGEGARDELSLFTETSVCPNSSAALPFPVFSPAGHLEPSLCSP